MTVTSNETAALIKDCCSAAYDHDLVSLVLGDSYHPGGKRLTRHLGEAVGMSLGSRVLDIASGPGTTAMIYAGEFGADVIGVDYSATAVDRANARAADAGLSESVRFESADAEALPIADESIDIAICECAFCTFPDKTKAAAEIARVLVPGGRFGMTDVTVDAEALDPELTGLASWVACLGGARTIDGYVAEFEAAGLRVVATEVHDGAIVAMLDQIRARIDVARLSMPALFADLDDSVVDSKLRLACQAASNGHIGYRMMVCAKPN